MARQLREARGLSANAAGKRAGITGQWWRLIEQGHELRGGREIPVKPSRKTVIAMASALEWNAAEALALAGFDPAIDPESDVVTIRELPMDDWRRLTDGQRDILCALVKSMVKA